MLLACTYLLASPRANDKLETVWIQGKLDEFKRMNRTVKDARLCAARADILFGNVEQNKTTVLRILKYLQIQRDIIRKEYVKLLKMSDDPSRDLHIVLNAQT